MEDKKMLIDVCYLAPVPTLLKLSEIADRCEGVKRGFLSCKGRVNAHRLWWAGLRLLKDRVGV